MMTDLISRNFPASAAAVMLAKARQELAKRQLDAMRRPVGTKAIDIGFYDRRQAERAPTTKILWCVDLVRWTGSDWRRVRKLSGPLSFQAALDRAHDEAARRGLSRTL